jgi:hypothetical protein
MRKPETRKILHLRVGHSLDMNMVTTALFIRQFHHGPFRLHFSSTDPLSSRTARRSQFHKLLSF